METTAAESSKHHYTAFFNLKTYSSELTLGFWQFNTNDNSPYRLYYDLCVTQLTLDCPPFESIFSLINEFGRVC